MLEGKVVIVAINTFTRFVAEELRESNVCVVIFSPRVHIATEGAPEEALSRLARPEVLGNGFVLAAQTPIESSGKIFSFLDSKLVDQALWLGIISLPCRFVSDRA
jgi:glutamate racemase